MNPDLILPLIGFAFVTSVTPGPNNMMLLASGLNFGLGRTVPHMAGITLGYGLMIVICGLGLAQPLIHWPALALGLKWVSVGYMLWLAWKLAQSASPRAGGAGASAARPMTFLQAAAFQWVNPKAWVMALGAISAFAGTSTGGVLVVALTCALVGLPSVAVWTFAGDRLARVLTDPRNLRLFNWTMAGLLVLSLIPALLH